MVKVSAFQLKITFPQKNKKKKKADETTSSKAILPKDFKGPTMDADITLLRRLILDYKIGKMTGITHASRHIVRVSRLTNDTLKRITDKDSYI